jgi:pimeloyl-ACP methyl ester carboxylesterase
VTLKPHSENLKRRITAVRCQPVDGGLSFEDRGPAQFLPVASLKGFSVAVLVLKIVGALVLLDFLVQAAFARVFIPHFERKPRLRARSYPRRRQAGSFTTRTSDNVVLRGSILRSRVAARGVVIFCHEFGGDRWSFQGHCDDAVLSGQDLVTFDFRNHGESDVDRGYESSHWLTQREVLDVQALIDWVQTRREWAGLPVTLIGVSRGANAALAAAASRNVQGVLAVGAFSTLDLAFDHLLAGIQRHAPIFLRFPHWHIRSTMALAIRWSGLRQKVRFVSIERAARQLTGLKVLFIAGSDDSHIPESFQRKLSRRLKDAHFWSVPGGRHNLERDAAPEEFDRRVRGFLTAVTGHSSASPARELAAAD